MENEEYNKNHAASIDYVNSAIVQEWNAMKQYIADQSVEPDLKPLILARMAAIINEPNIEWSTIMSQVQYIEQFKADLQTVCEEKGLIVSDLPLIQWISAIRMALGVFGCYIYAIDDQDVEHFYTKPEWEVLKTQASQGLITLPDVVGIIINNSSATRIMAVEQYAAYTWGSYGRQLYNMSNPSFDGMTQTRKVLQQTNPFVSKYYLNDPEVIIVEDYADIDTSTAPTAYTHYVVVTSAGENTVAVGSLINRGTSENPMYIDVKSGEPEIGQTMETFTATLYYWNGTTLAQQYAVPYKDSSNTIGSPSAEHCAKYKAFDGDVQEWYEPKQDELQLMCVNGTAVTELAQSVLSTWVLSGWVWSSEQNNDFNINAYFTNFPGGGSNYNNKNLGFTTVPFSVFRRGKA